MASTILQQTSSAGADLAIPSKALRTLLREADTRLTEETFGQEVYYRSLPPESKIFPAITFSTVSGSSDPEAPVSLEIINLRVWSDDDPSEAVELYAKLRRAVNGVENLLVEGVKILQFTETVPANLGRDDDFNWWFHRGLWLYRYQTQAIT